jgi:malate dehydrogenase (oxaloacetate-decarboxylating)(NADP+)
VTPLPRPRPILLGREEAIRSAFEELGLEAAGITITDPDRSTRRDDYAEQYFQMRRRRGAMKTTATARMRQPDYFGAMMLRSGDADMMISGYAAHYADSLRMILRVIGTAPGVDSLHGSAGARRREVTGTGLDRGRRNAARDGAGE